MTLLDAHKIIKAYEQNKVFTNLVRENKIENAIQYLQKEMKNG